MPTLVNALRTNDTFTENGMVTNSTSLNNCVDLFFQVGAMRGQDKQRLINTFSKAYGESPLTALRLLFWTRDIRGGAGERQIFRDLIVYLANTKTQSLKKNLVLIPEFGRWDDLLSLIGTPLEKNALKLIGDALVSGNQLVAKWMPRPNVSDKVRKAQGNILRKSLNLTPKAYRKLLVSNSNTVEQLMCANEWEDIEYSKLPSKAMSDYMKSFSKHDKEGFQAYLESVKKGEAKINTGAIYPYDIVKNLRFGNKSGANVQWAALPNFMENNNERVLPVCDVSGSMDQNVAGNENLSVMDICISLGLYISEKNIGAFKDVFFTFSDFPTLQVLKGELSDRYKQLAAAEWGYSTNLQATYKVLLEKAVKFNVPESEMPTMLLILSDMQFNSGVRDYENDTAQSMVEKMYAAAGYKMPKIVYWNLASRSNQSPVSFDKRGTALVSGFSVSILKNLLSGRNLSPIDMMNSVINSERYCKITL